MQTLHEKLAPPATSSDHYGIIKVTPSSNRQGVLVQQAKWTLQNPVHRIASVVHVFVDGSPTSSTGMIDLATQNPEIVYLHLPQNVADPLKDGYIPQELQPIVKQHLLTPDVRSAAVQNYYETWRNRVVFPNNNFITLGEMRNIAIESGASLLRAKKNSQIESDNIIVVNQDDDDLQRADYVPYVVQAFIENPKAWMIKPQQMLVFNLPTMTVGVFDHKRYGQPGILFEDNTVEVIDECYNYIDKDSTTPDQHGYMGSNGTCMNFRYSAWEQALCSVNVKGSALQIKGYGPVNRAEDHLFYDTVVRTLGSQSGVLLMQIPAATFVRLTLFSTSRSHMHALVMPGALESKVSGAGNKLAGTLEEQFQIPLQQQGVSVDSIRELLNFVRKEIGNPQYAEILKIFTDRVISKVPQANLGFVSEDWHTAVAELIDLTGTLINTTAEKIAASEDHPDMAIFSGLIDEAKSKQQTVSELLGSFFESGPAVMPTLSGEIAKKIAHDVPVDTAWSPLDAPTGASGSTHELLMARMLFANNGQERY